MSAVGTGAIGPVSVRYAAQIRQLLFAQAIQRIAADQEAARAQSNADRAARVEPAPKSEEPKPVEISETIAEPKLVVTAAPAQLVDIQA